MTGLQNHNNSPKEQSVLRVSVVSSHLVKMTRLDGVTRNSSVDSVNTRADEQEERFVTNHRTADPRNDTTESDRRLTFNVMSQKAFQPDANDEQLVKQKKVPNPVAYKSIRTDSSGALSSPLPSQSVGDNFA